MIFPYPFSVPTSGFAPLSLTDDDAPGVDAYDPAVIPTNFGGTIGSQIFSGFTETGDFYVELANGAFFEPGTPTWLNGLNSTYDGITVPDDGILDVATFNFLEQRFFHFTDDGSLGLFWFGFVPDPIDQSLIFNTFGAFNGDVTGLNVQIRGLPFLPGQTQNIGQALNNIGPFAGGNQTPDDLNEIETAAGGNQGNQTPDDLNEIETAAGENEACWSNAVDIAGGGQIVNVVYGGSFDDNLNQAVACGGAF
jgi:hypothetical protein